MSLRWSEDQYRAYVTRGQPAPVSEDVFLAAVLKIARTAGFLAYHTYRSTKSAEGFPDLILCHREPGHVCYAVELKMDTGQVTLAQQAWLDALGQCTGVVSACWRPSMLDTIVAQLRR